MLKKILTTIALVLGVLLVAPLFIPAESIKQTIEEQVSEASGMAARLETVSFHILPRPGATITGLTLNDIPDGAPRLTVGSGDLRLSLMPLLSGKAEVSGIRFGDIIVRTSDSAKGDNITTIRLDKVTGNIKASADKLALPGWRILLYQGQIFFDGVLQPIAEPKKTFAGKLQSSDIQIKPLLRDATGQAQLSGSVSSELTFSASGKNGDEMGRTLKVDGPVRLESGTMEDIELEGIAGLLVPAASKNLIEYKQIKTNLSVRGKEIQANDIEIDATGFSARGNITIKPDTKLDGTIEVGTLGGISGAKLLVGGTTDSPRVFPAPSSIIGGALGSAVGGPAGAAVGAKIGSKIGDILKGAGGKQEETSEQQDLKNK